MPSLSLYGELQGSVVELWACPGGCITGGGQLKASDEIVSRRREWVEEIGSSIHAKKV